MAHGRQKPGLGFVGRIGGPAGFFKYCSVFDMASDIMEGTEPGILVLVAGGNEPDVQVATVDLQVGLPRLDEVMLQVEGGNQFGGVLPLLGVLVFQQHFMVAAAYDA
ncbi:hypothetical protein D3C77_172430 [compost metagenome]